MTFRVTPESARRIRAFLADYAGKPLYLKPGPFVEAAIMREIQRLELAMSTGAPIERVTGHDPGDQDEPPPRLSRTRPPINAT